MKVCDQNDELLPLASSGIHDLIVDGVSYINDNEVNLADILPPVIAPPWIPRKTVSLYQVAMRLLTHLRMIKLWKE